MASFNDFLDAFKDGLEVLVQDVLVEHKDKVLAGSEAFLKECEGDLQKWTEQLANDELSGDDFKFLVQGKNDLLEVHLHTQIGLTKVALDKFRSALVQLIVETAFTTFL
jgi:hypothetical protein